MMCLYPNCGNTSRTRGLCHGHYQVMRDRVRNGRVYERDLEERGLLTPKGTGGSPARDTAGAFEKGSSVQGRGRPHVNGTYADGDHESTQLTRDN